MNGNEKMNKFILEFILYNKHNTLEIIIHFWDNDFLYDSIDEYKNVYYSDENGFKLYSFDNGEIYSKTFVIPEKSFLKPEHKIKCNFDTEFERYKYLKDLYLCLNSWSKNWNIFVQKGITSNHNINMYGNFWTL